MQPHLVPHQCHPHGSLARRRGRCVSFQSCVAITRSLIVAVPELLLRAGAPVDIRPRKLDAFSMRGQEQSPGKETLSLQCAVPQPLGSPCYSPAVCFSDVAMQNPALRPSARSEERNHPYQQQQRYRSLANTGCRDFAQAYRGKDAQMDNPLRLREPPRPTIARAMLWPAAWHVAIRV